MLLVVGQHVNEGQRREPGQSCIERAAGGEEDEWPRVSGCARPAPRRRGSLLPSSHCREARSRSRSVRAGVSSPPSSRGCRQRRQASRNPGGNGASPKPICKNSAAGGGMAPANKEQRPAPTAWRPRRYRSEWRDRGADRFFWRNAAMPRVPVARPPAKSAAALGHWPPSCETTSMATTIAASDCHQQEARRSKRLKRWPRGNRGQRSRRGR